MSNTTRAGSVQVAEEEVAAVVHERPGDGARPRSTPTAPGRRTATADRRPPRRELVRRVWHARTDDLRTRTSEPALAAFYRSYQAREGSSSAFAVKHPLATVLAAVAVLRLPLVRLDTSDTHGGRAVADVLTSPGPLHLPRATTGLAVLEVPEDPARYSLGSAKQTLRHRVRLARRSGTTWREVTSVAERDHLHALARRFETEHPDATYRSAAPARLEPHEDDLWIAAFSAAGEPLLLAIASLDAPGAVLRFYRTLGSSEAHSDSRYLVAEALVAALSARGVRWVAASEHPSVLPVGLRDFQRWLGFRTVRLRVVTRGVGRSARRAASGAASAA